MPVALPPNVPPNLVGQAASAIVRQAEKQNATPRDQGKKERDAEAQRQRDAPNRHGTSGKG